MSDIDSSDLFPDFVQLGDHAKPDQNIPTQPSTPISTYRQFDEPPHRKLTIASLLPLCISPQLLGYHACAVLIHLLTSKTSRPATTQAAVDVEAFFDLAVDYIRQSVHTSTSSPDSAAAFELDFVLARFLAEGSPVSLASRVLPLLLRVVRRRNDVSDVIESPLTSLTAVRVVKLAIQNFNAIITTLADPAMFVATSSLNQFVKLTAIDGLDAVGAQKDWTVDGVIEQVKIVLKLVRELLALMDLREPIMTLCQIVEHQLTQLVHVLEYVVKGEELRILPDVLDEMLSDLYWSVRDLGMVGEDLREWGEILKAVTPWPIEQTQTQSVAGSGTGLKVMLCTVSLAFIAEFGLCKLGFPIQSTQQLLIDRPLRIFQKKLAALKVGHEVREFEADLVNAGLALDGLCSRQGAGERSSREVDVLLLVIRNLLKSLVDACLARNPEAGRLLGRVAWLFNRLQQAEMSGVAGVFAEEETARECPLEFQETQSGCDESPPRKQNMVAAKCPAISLPPQTNQAYATFHAMTPVHATRPLADASRPVRHRAKKPKALPSYQRPTTSSVAKRQAKFTEFHINHKK